VGEKEEKQGGSIALTRTVQYVQCTVTYIYVLDSEVTIQSKGIFFERRKGKVDSS
jgi:hypothetical protein